MRFVVAGILLLCSGAVVGQAINDELFELYDHGLYEEAIRLASAPEELDAQGRFYLGLCYFSLSDDETAIQWFDRALQLDPDLAPAYFFKGNALIYLSRPQEALRQFEEAIGREPGVADYQEARGNALYHLGQKEEAIASYEAAVALDGCPTSAFLMLGRAYHEGGYPQKALETYYRALGHLEPTEDAYGECLFNIGLLQYLQEDYADSEKAFLDLLELRPDHYHAIAKLVQVYYAEGATERGEALKKELYGAYQRDELPGPMQKEGFCFDQFLWEGKRVYAFEKFEEPTGLYYKHVFYVTDEEDRVEATVQTEHSHAVVMVGKKYVLGKTEGARHYTYFEHLFDEQFEYADLKKAVLKVLKGKSKPSSSVYLGGK